MECQRYKPFYMSDEGLTLRPGQSAKFTFDAGQDIDGRRARLFATGETALFYLWKDEPDYPRQYRKIEDALDTDHADKAQYCLDLSNPTGVDYVKRVYKKVLWPPMLSYLPMHDVPESWTAGIMARAEGLEFERAGYLRLSVEVYHAHAGVSRHSVEAPPDEVFTIEFPGGDYAWTRLETSVRIPRDAAHVGVVIEGAGYTGSVYLERPFLKAQGFNLLPDFTTSTSDAQKFDWTGCNLSRKEWPEFHITLNGRDVFDGEVFERSHRCSEWEVRLPKGLLRPCDNELEITLTSCYRDPLPYTLHELALLTEADGVFELVACPQSACAGGVAALLVRTETPGAEVRMTESNGLSLAAPARFEQPGLHVIQLSCPAPMLNAGITLQCGDERLDVVVPRIVKRADDGIITGTGDMIYVHQDPDSIAEYLSWYLSQYIGNMLTIRPTYRWSGSRVLDEASWRMTARLLDGMGVKYAHMLDGRELPGIDANPSLDMLAGPSFLGRQNHERDGSQFYWGTRHSGGSLTEEQYADLAQRIYCAHPDTTSGEYHPGNYIYHGDDMFQFRRPDVPRDMGAAHDFSVGMLRAMRLGAPRHTGPSVMFKYLYEAGYDFLGAETMYGSMEPLMAFLRGATYGCGKRELSVHHAVQWSTSPHDTPERFRRYRLALYVSYMQGATQINTEEGLWHMEEYYAHHHRFSDACLGHKRQQVDFYRYVSTHSRTGSFYTPLALLHGRLDGWHAFGPNHPWGLPDVMDCDAEKSWDLLKLFYPLSQPGRALYIHGCPNEPVGYHSGTPRGNVDAVPVEAGLEAFKRYRALAFMGYNCAQADDLDKLLEYVESGGILVLGWAHLNAATGRDNIENYRHVYPRHALVDRLGGMPEFAQDSANGAPLMVNRCLGQDAMVLARTDGGSPLMVEYRWGQGRVLLLNAREYPANIAVRATYEAALASVCDALWESEPGAVICSDDVETAVYAQPDGTRHYYVLAVDWYREPEKMRRATLRLQSASYPVELPFGVMLKLVADGSRAAWCLSEDGEVLRLDAHGAVVQGTGRLRFALAADGEVKFVDVDFDEPVKSLGF